MDTRIETTNDAELGIAKLKIAYSKVYQVNETKTAVMNMALEVLGKMEDSELFEFIKRHERE